MVLVPPDVVTVTLTTPEEPAAGEVAVIWLPVLTVNAVAAVSPNVTAVAPLKLVPVIVITVPPATDPVAGEMLAIDGIVETLPITGTSICFVTNVTV